MKADLSRLTFDPLNSFARVLQQQGRPLLDSDWNEQASIMLHRLHMLGRDLIGPHGGPSGEECGFEITGLDGHPHDFEIGAGRYYVNGVCCENPHKVWFSKQPVPVAESVIETGKYYLVYLDVWEDLIGVASYPNLIDPALGGIDTALRTRIAWQVHTFELAPPTNDAKYVADNWGPLVENWQPPRRGSLRARIASEAEDSVTNIKLAEPVRRYRGPENQLYRVEIHYGGTASGGRDGATLKWSRENASIVLRLTKFQDNKLLVLDRLDATGAGTLVAGDWLEEIVPGSGHYGTPRRPLIHVTGRGSGRNEVLVDPATVRSGFDLGRPGGVWLRRWDQQPHATNRGGRPWRDGTVVIGEGERDAAWIALEAGVEVQFAPGAVYRPGDYWLIPARITGDGSLLWPMHDGAPASLPPYGVQHAYAPLAIVGFNPIAERRQSCRRAFKMLASMAI